MNISQALAKSTGASAEIILTSSSHFMMRLMRASGRSLWFLKSCSVPMSSAFICVCMPGSSNGSGSGGGDSGQKDKAGIDRENVGLFSFVLRSVLHPSGDGLHRRHHLQLSSRKR